MPEVIRTTPQTGGEKYRLPKSKASPIGLYRIIFLASIVSTLIQLFIFETILLFIVSYGLGLAWVMFEIFIVFKAVIGVQQMLVFMSQPQKKEGKGKNV